jgi:hypothetical protein
VVALTVRDAHGTAVFRDATVIPRWGRAEFRGVGPLGEPIIEGHTLPLEPRVFVARVPVTPDASLEVDVGPRPPATLRLDVPRAPRAAGPSPVPLPGWDHGDPANRFDILVMGDGYTEESVRSSRTPRTSSSSISPRSRPMRSTGTT